jgi:hypothetical protein
MPFGNGFYAANKQSCDGDGAYHPVLKVTTREFGESVEVRVWDNGIGIPPEKQGKAVLTVLHDQADRRGYRTWAVDQLRDCNATARGAVTVDSQVGDFTEFTCGCRAGGIWLRERWVNLGMSAGAWSGELRSGKLRVFPLPRR